jgi:GT2 family glycosyltransferase
MSFSIVVPVGAWSPFLAAALRSLALQEVALEVALCDASGDPRVAADADRSGLAFAYRRHGPDAGQADAIAEGWERTGGTFLGWLNADDLLLPGALADAAAAFASDPRLDVWFGQTTFFDEAGATIGRHDAVAPAGPLLLRSCTISQPSCFARRTAVAAAGGIDRSRRYTMDWELWVRLYRAGARFADTPSYYSAVLINEGSKTSSASLTRLREIYDTVRAGAGRWTAAKSVIGVSLHHLVRYSSAGPTLVRLARRRAASQPGADGGGPSRIATPMTLPILNLGDTPQRRLAVRLSGPGAADATLEVGDVQATGPTVELSLAAPVASGEATQLALTPGPAPTWLDRAFFVEA